MTGRRESVLARVFAIGEGINTWALTGRNLPAIPPDGLPGFVMWDGGQTIIESKTARQAFGMMPFQVHLAPTLAIAFQGDQETIGAGANELHDTLMHAVLSDTALYQLLENKQVEYLDTDFALLPGTEEPSIALYLHFGMRFVLRPSELGPGSA